MHPIMSDLDITIRQFEHKQALHTFQRQMLARDIASITGRQGLLGRLADTVREFLDPRGFALQQLRATDLRQGTVGTMQVAPPAITPAEVHTFPAIISKDRERTWRTAA